LVAVAAVGTRPAQRLSVRYLALGWAVAFAISVGGALLGGELGYVALGGLQGLPFAMLAMLAYIGTRRAWAKVLAVLWLACIGLVLLLIDVGFGMRVVGLDPSSPRPPVPGAVGLLLEELLGIFVVGLLAIAMLLRPVRRAVARILPIDPESFVHAVAVAAVVLMALMAVLPLFVLGQPPLLVALQDVGRDRAGQMRDQVYGLLWLVPSSFAMVGYGIRRSFRGALERLGLVRPTRRYVLIGLGASVVLLAVSWLTEAGIAALWAANGWPRTDNEAFEKLIAFAFTPLGALVLAVTAGLGEEIAVRGVLQPRLGILVSNLFFVSLHGLQYNWDALLSVFVGGLLLALLRKRTNTTTSAIAHGSYDFLSVLSSLLGSQ
jgi:membrane protease YdiL (CAAX protease family)